MNTVRWTWARLAGRTRTPALAAGGRRAGSPHASRDTRSRGAFLKLEWLQTVVEQRQRTGGHLHGSSLRSTQRSPARCREILGDVFQKKELSYFKANGSHLALSKHLDPDLPFPLSLPSLWIYQINLPEDCGKEPQMEDEAITALHGPETSSFSLL